MIHTIHSVSSTKRRGVISNTRGAAKKRYARDARKMAGTAIRKAILSELNSSRHKARPFSSISGGSTTAIIRERVANDANANLPPVATMKAQKCYDIQDDFGRESLHCHGLEQLIVWASVSLPLGHIVRYVAKHQNFIAGYHCTVFFYISGILWFKGLPQISGFREVIQRN